MYSDQAIVTLKKINEESTDPEIQPLHHYIFYYNGRSYTYDRDYIDRDNGSITGYVLGMDRNNYIVSKETFCIEPDGNITKKGIFRNFALKRKIIKAEKDDHKPVKK